MDPTFVTCLTPPGVGAIATLVLCGPQSISIVGQVANVAEFARIPIPRLARITGADGVEQVVIAVKQTEPWPTVEVHCHGGVAVVRMLEEMFVAKGATLISPATWLQRSGLSQIKQKALALLCQAPTARTAGILLDQYQGALERALAEMEEASRRGDVQTAQRLKDRLAQLTPVGRHVVEPFRVVVAGPPNVGKSSLVNAIAGYTRSVVSPMPGTTRDVVGTRIALDGWPVELLDTAGLREAGEELEEAGMALAAKALESADLCLWVVDGSTTMSEPRPLGSGPRTEVVINKVDLPPAWDQTTLQAPRVSALTGAGVTELCDTIARRLVPYPPLPGEAIPIP
ncbi:MAG: 50S ribosome-binding GTPase [Gemmataceae bacterium]|nr:50S ribosome-binding GTPase [Gemmataceae bacterium]